MALPSRKKQIERVMELLDFGDEISLEMAATSIVDGYLKAIKPKEVFPPPHPGMGFTTPYDLNVWFIAWQDHEKAWLVNEKTHFGSWVKLNSDFWGFIEEKKDRRRTNLDKPYPGSPNNNPNHQVGDLLSLGQRQHMYRVIATGDKCVLMENTRTGDLQTDSNSNLERYYRKEVSEDVEF